MSQQKQLPPELREIWRDLYALHASFYDMGNTVEEWQVWWRTAATIVNKYNGHKLAEELALGLASFMESERKANAEEGDGCGTEEQTSLTMQRESNQPSQLGMF